MKAAVERRAPWETLGASFPAGITAEESLEKAGLNYEVGITNALVQLPVHDYDTITVPFPRKRVTYRKDTFTPLGFVGDRYRVLQHEEVLPLLDALTGTGWTPLCGGTLKGGAVGWLVGSLPYYPKSGEFEPNLAVMNSFDLSSGLRFANTPLRPVCNNAVQLMMRGAKSSFVLKHSKHMELRFEEARAALKIAVAYAKKLDEEIERLLEVKVELPEARKLVNHIIPVHNVDVEMSERTIKLREEKQDDIIRHWLTSETIEDIRFTGWGWVNALNEMDQWTPRPKTNEQQLAERTLLTQLNAVSGTWTSVAHRSLISH
jgi:phage/plasmid-like protein (TIGR03299 family)